MITKGQKINDRYEIIKSIGEGGMANVYLAHDIILDRDVAIKVLRGDLSSDDKFVRRFQREALAASSLSHPNIVEMYDVGEDSGTYYIVMEYVNGRTLKQLLKKRGALSLSECIDIMLQLTDGVEHAHTSYIIHRDIKPQNIMILDNGEIKITDFGIAMALNNTQLTQTNSVMGSVHYLPPEQASGKGSTVKSDIYSMGILFFELITGTLPFKGDNAVEIALKHIREDIPSVKKINNSIPQSIENIIMKASAKNPKNRYNSAKEMHDDLLTALNENRINEPIVVFKYPEHDTFDEKKVLSTDFDNSKLLSEDEEGEEKTNIWLWILSGVFLVIVLALIGIFLIYPSVSSIPEIKIPDVSGMTLEKATTILEKDGFTIKEIEKIGDDYIEKGLMIKTSPNIGKKVKKGTEIILYQSTGKIVYVIENYVGKNYEEVKKILENNYELNVVIEKIDPEDDLEHQPTEIIKQDLEVGLEVSKGTNITLYIPEDIPKYPDFTDGTWTKETIQKFCDEKGVIVNFEIQIVSGYSEGDIISQGYASGTPAIKGATINITVAGYYENTSPNDDSNVN